MLVGQRTLLIVGKPFYGRGMRDRSAVKPRFAYFIMVHHKPEQFEWLMNAIYDPDDLFIVHVDRKSRLGLKADRRGVMREVRRICADRRNIVIMRSRFTNWGGWSLSRILIDAVRLAILRDERWTHFINLSGQCYPLKPIEAIRQALAEGGEQIYVEMRPFAELPDDDWHLNWHPMLETPLRALILPGRRRPPSDFAIAHKGSQWVILPRVFCEWMMTAPLRRSIRRYMRNLLLTDELVVQAYAANGPFRDQVAPDYRREIVWPGPKVMRMDDLPRLRSSQAWFARKFDVQTDAAVLRTLAEANGFRPGPAPVSADQRG